MRELTFLETIKAGVTNPAGFELSVLERSLVGAAGSTDDLPTGPAVVAPVDQTELRAAGLTHRHPGVRGPHGGRVSQLVSHVQRTGDLVQVDEGRLPAPVVLYGTVEGVQPVISLLDTPTHKILKNVYKILQNIYKIL